MFYQSALGQVSMWLTALGRADLRRRGGEEDDLDVSRDNMNI